MVPEQLTHHFSMKSQKIPTITGKTSLIGVIGNPIQHSLSPIIHNAAFNEMDLDWCYLPIRCEKNNLELVLKGLREINCKGLNITIPHKTNVINICNKVDSIAKKIGAVNTLIPNKMGGWTGSNTDIDGFLYSLQFNNNWTNKKAIILGSGGSAKAIVFGLQRIGFSEIIIVNRKADSIERFLKNLNINQEESYNKYLKINGLLITSLEIIEKIQNADLIINTTPVGMYQAGKGKEESNSIPFGEEIWENLNSKTTLYDLIYNPRPTKWLKIGAKYGCKQINGLEMLIQQGAESLRKWSGFQDIPINIMREAAKNYLLH